MYGFVLIPSADALTCLNLLGMSALWVITYIKVICEKKTKYLVSIRIALFALFEKFINSMYVLQAFKDTGKAPVEAEVAIHRIRITLTSRNVKSLEKGMLVAPQHSSGIKLMAMRIIIYMT